MNLFCHVHTLISHPKTLKKFKETQRNIVLPFYKSCSSPAFKNVFPEIIQVSSVAQTCPTLETPQTAACQASLSITNSQNLLKFMSIESVMLSNHLVLCRPLFLPPSIFPRVFSKESVLFIRWPKYWSFSFSISTFNEYSGLVSFRMGWFDLLGAQVTLKSLPQKPQFESINSSALRLLYGPTLTSIHDY